MRLDLTRAWFPQELEGAHCSICKHPFELEVVQVMGDGGYVCPSCIEYLGRRNPECFPSLEEFEQAKRRHPYSIWSSEEDLWDLDPELIHTEELMYLDR